QVEGDNYLLPTDVDFSSYREQQQALGTRMAMQSAHAVRFDDVVLKGLQRASARLILIDACRDNPLQERDKGFAIPLGVQQLPNTAIVFSAGPGETASDGKQRNSPFAQELLELMKAPQKKQIVPFLNELQGRVKHVTEGTSNPQTPWLHTNLGG